MISDKTEEEFRSRMQKEKQEYFKNIDEQRRELIRDNSNFFQQLKEIENGRFYDVIRYLNISDHCGRCSFFDREQPQTYRCACIGSCIGVTLSEKVKSYLIEKLKEN